MHAHTHTASTHFTSSHVPIITHYQKTEAGIYIQMHLYIYIYTYTHTCTRSLTHSFNAAQRVGAGVYKGTLFSACGFLGSLGGTTLAYLLFQIRRLTNQGSDGKDAALPNVLGKRWQPNFVLEVKGLECTEMRSVVLLSKSIAATYTWSSARMQCAHACFYCMTLIHESEIVESASQYACTHVYVYTHARTRTHTRVHASRDFTLSLWFYTLIHPCTDACARTYTHTHSLSLFTHTHTQTHDDI
jgi:hypothetical protein